MTTLSYYIQPTQNDVLRDCFTAAGLFYAFRLKATLLFSMFVF